MKENKEFDLWSDGYGAEIHLLNDKDEYPVAGYANLLNEVYQMIRSSDAKKILDAGFGTGIITQKLYHDGYEISGMDTSEQLVTAGHVNMPKANLVCCDYSMGMPLNFIKEEFDMIISTYAFHHIDRFEKRELLEDMYRHLKDGGKIIIGDLAFDTMKSLKEFRNANKEKWLYDQMYMLYDDVIADFPTATWQQISKCAGIVTITKE